MLTSSRSQMTIRSRRAPHLGHMTVILDALRQHVLDTWPSIEAHPQAAEFTHLVESTPVLRAYAERMWTWYTDTLSAAIADEFGVDPSREHLILIRVPSGHGSGVLRACRPDLRPDDESASLIT